MLNLDTHILVHAAGGKLTAHERKLLEHDLAWSISGVVLWEITMLHRRKRIEYGLDHAPLDQFLRRIHVWPITSKVCSFLDQLDFQSDPADELIAATSLAYNLPLLTRDEKLRASKRVRCL
jgi:PIN domain nuclease of toxin-antitoxin system